MVSTDNDQRHALEAELAQVEFAIQAHAGTHLHELDQKRWQIKRRINTHCPILRVPPEISLRFFMTTFPTNSFSDWGKATPLLFGVICHEWRDLAWSFPLLWSSVSFTVKDYTERKNNLLQEWLVRSQSLPLSIYLRMNEPQDESNVLWKDTMDIIARCSERWWIIDFHLISMFHDIICFVPTQFPLLISMSVCMTSAHNTYYRTLISEIGDDLWNVKWNAPKLQYIRIDSYVGQFINLSLNRIIDFMWLSPSMSQTCLETLKDAPNLVKCRFEGMRGMSINQLPSVTALRLRTLDIGFEHANICMPEFLDNLTTPALKELSISENYHYTPFPSGVLVSFLSRSSCHLMRLSLSNLDLLPDELANCFSATPSLTELRLEGIEIKRETFKDLSMDETSQNILLPNLESFVYKYGISSEHTPDYPGLLRMATSRLHFGPFVSTSLGRVAKLKSIHIDFTDAHFVAIIDRKAPESIARINSADEQDDNTAEGENSKLNANLIARFQGLIAEGMDIRIMGHNIIVIDSLKLGLADALLAIAGIAATQFLANQKFWKSEECNM